MEASPAARRASVSAALLGALLLAVLIRFHGLDRESVWLDEALSVRLASGSWSSLLAGTSEDGHPPAYLAALHLWMAACGRSETAVRALSAIFGVLAIPLAWRLARDLAPGRSSGTAAAFILATAPYHVYYSQEARNYALLMTASLLAGLLFVRVMQGTERRLALPYAGAVVLLLYTHVYAFFVWAAHLAALAAGWRAPGARRAAWAQAAVACALVPWVLGPWALRLLRQSLPATTGLRMARPTLAELGASFVQLSGSPHGAMLLLGLAAAGLASMVRRALPAETAASPEAPSRVTPPWAVVLLVAWLLLPHLVPFVFSQLAVPVYLTRATIVSLPALVLLADRGASTLRPAIAGAAVSALVVVSLWALSVYLRAPSKEQWRELARFEEAALGPEGVVAFDAGYGRTGFEYYLPASAFSRLALPADVTTPAGAAAFRDAVQGRARVDLVRFQRPPAHAAVMGALAGYRVVEIRPFFGLWLYRFVPARPS